MTMMPRALVRSGWYREVRVKSREAMLARSLLGARTQLLGIVTDLSNQIRGVMKTVPKGAGTVFEANVRRLLEDEAAVAAIVLPLLDARAGTGRRPRPPASEQGARERRLPSADDDPRRRRRRRSVLRDRNAGNLHQITRCRRLDDA